MTREHVSVTVNFRRDKPAIIQPQDSIDLGENGIIVWLYEEDAEAWRLIQKKKMRELREKMDNGLIIHDAGLFKV